MAHAAEGSAVVRHLAEVTGFFALPEFVVDDVCLAAGEDNAVGAGFGASGEKDIALGDEGGGRMKPWGGGRGGEVGGDFGVAARKVSGRKEAVEGGAAEDMGKVGRGANRFEYFVEEFAFVDGGECAGDGWGVVAVTVADAEAVSGMPDGVCGKGDGGGGRRRTGRNRKGGAKAVAVPVLEGGAHVVENEEEEGADIGEGNGAVFLARGMKGRM